ncbi:MAG: zf-HC2 domain-containing protein [Deltaproteobacteria bacterium]|nr:MAG: zf-HC2 domain-containing protein [Deltaproteobacteria bacterium]
MDQDRSLKGEEATRRRGEGSHPDRPNRIGPPASLPGRELLVPLEREGVSPPHPPDHATTWTAAPVPRRSHRRSGGFTTLPMLRGRMGERWEKIESFPARDSSKERRVSFLIHSWQRGPVPPRLEIVPAQCQAFLQEDLVMNCSEVVEHLCDYVEGELPFDLQRQLEGHLSHCIGCTDFLASYRWIPIFCQKLWRIDVPPTVRTKLRDLIHRRIVRHEEPPPSPTSGPHGLENL